MHRGAGNEARWPFVCKVEQRENDVYGLQDRHRLHSEIKVLGVEIEEELGPETGMERGR